MKAKVMTVVGLIGFFSAMVAYSQEISKLTVPGVANFNRLETTIACAGEVKATAVPDIKKLGFASIINLRLANEEGADLEAEAAAAKSTGIRYYWIPFNGAMPDPAVADQFLDVITAKGNEPAFIHCHTGNRAAAMWMIKRLVVDHWDADHASKEAAALGLTSGALKQFALDYAQGHRR